jgi:DNA repair photolyase
MRLVTEEKKVRSVLSQTGIPGIKYCINPYVGCSHACRYCYATFMKRFTGHIEPWGRFVDIKINAPEVLRKQLKKTEKGSIIMSSVTDPYQPLETKYLTTRRCLEELTLFRFPINILTKSPLVLRDIDLITKLKDAEVGLTITTDSENMRKLFEPGAPPIQDRIDALRKLHKKGVKTYVFIGPVLPMNPENLVKKVTPFADSILIDRLNYKNNVQWIYKKHRLEKWFDDDFIDTIISKLVKGFAGKDINVC